tara:strand:+ start:240 stop:419 length:180 start_codon:yes stop_codon:yes gene_type:complete
MKNLTADERVRLEFLEDALQEHLKTEQFILSTGQYMASGINLAKVKVILEILIADYKNK